MNDYIRVDVVGAGLVDRYLKDGWEIVETAKQSYPDGETKVDYHIGLPARVLVDKLTAIIKDYEAHGLNEQLFDGVAKGFDENASDYETGMGHATSSKTARYMENYEMIVNNKEVVVNRKYTQEELAERAEYNF
ncbi:hypothetical protein COJ85_13930 [Bacillus sp. AFS076308]|uniref:hypothetical protein n=1 Tax=Bacillus sp. AFS076308 TaxID=2033512 RepID=UPI000BF8D1D2|nr:hypothetical protein [Bacillus sp. AFS076308]PFO03738.1 hypothetical protein COJ85_13930 [Bacillus sp. AFS076308]